MHQTLSSAGAPEVPFTETPYIRKRRRAEKIAQTVLAMLVPLFLIIGYLVKEGAPLISWEFLTTNPISGMRRGGIWSALLGTLWLVGVSLAVSAPIGVLAAVYLNEYAKDNWFTRAVH